MQWLTSRSFEECVNLEELGWKHGELPWDSQHRCFAVNLKLARAVAHGDFHEYFLG